MPVERPLPQSIPRQKAYLYVFLICFTAMLLYFYSYPLNMESWEYIRQRNIGDIFQSIYKGTSNVSAVHEYDLIPESESRSTKSIFLQKLFLQKIVSTSSEFRENENNLHTSDFEKRTGNMEEIPSVTVEITTKDAESFREVSKNSENSKAKPSTTFDKIIQGFVVSSSASKSVMGENKSEEKSRQTFEKIPPEQNGDSYQSSDSIYKPKEYFKDATAIAYVTKNLQSLPTSETVKLDGDSAKASSSTLESVEGDSNFSPTSDLDKNLNNSEEKSLTKLTMKEQLVDDTPVLEKAKKLPKPEYSGFETAVDDASTAEAIEKDDSATNVHKTEIKETVNSDSKNDLRNEHTTAKNNLKSVDVDHVSVATVKKEIGIDSTNYNDSPKVSNEDTSRGTSNTVLEGTNTQSKLADQTVTNSAKVTADTIAHLKNESSVNSGIQNGFLVFSENCRIPDLDPMHSSIRHLVEKTPPLDCSKDYKPLTWTEGQVLMLNQTAIRERTTGEKYSCCYRTVKRKNNGKSDNDIETGKECKEIFDKGIIKDEFITVECTINKNHTTFYREFHSFIHDKSEVEERCSKHSDSQYSVLIIGVDAVSRMNMHRQLNKTAQYLLKEMGATEMYGFNKVGDNTFPNLIPLLLGYDERELPTTCWESTSHMPLDKCNFLWKRFAEEGYRTFYAEDSPHISSFNYIKKGFYNQPTDYYFRHFILAYEDALGRNKPLNCYLCVGSVSETEAVLHWTEQFASHFPDRPYFAFSWINSLTHDYLNMGSSGDHMYEKFFRSLHERGALKNTIVILMGDHGMRWGSIRNTYIGRLEERLPMLMIALPQNFKKEHPKFTKTLKQNSHRLVTPFDLHATLVHLLNLKNRWSFINPDKVSKDLSTNFTKRARSLFQLIPEDRSCDDAFIEEHWCTCETSLEADISSNIIRQVANFLVNHVNSLLKPVSQNCAHLTLDTISDARLWQPPSEHEGHSADDNIYTVVVHTKPGGAVFEGTIKISASKGTNTLLGTISRLNLYGNQSSCMDNAILRKYCYCL